MNTETSPKLIKPLNFEKKKILLLVLNVPLCEDTFFNVLWKKSLLKCCCDGGANRLLKATGKNDQVPDFICGDLDSLEETTKEYYCNKGTKLKYLYDQDNTDFTKTALFAFEYCQQNSIEYDCMVAFPSFGGRIDQTMANINTLFQIKSRTEKPVFLFSETDVAFLIDQGTTNVQTDSGLEGDWCALIPIGSKAERVFTSGFKYNLDGQSMEFGSLISTSNSLDTKDGVESVTITTSHPLLMTLGYKAELIKDNT